MGRPSLGMDDTRLAAWRACLDILSWKGPILGLKSNAAVTL